MKRKAFFLLTLVVASMTGAIAQVGTTDYSPTQCEGSAMPYPQVDPLLAAIPDSLTPVFINHVGRHGARFLSSSKAVKTVSGYLNRADSASTITPKGREMLKLCERVVTATASRWGALDSLGMAEQRAIASRTFMLCPTLFENTKISAISSYVPRCVASMDEYTHQLTRLNNKVEIYTSSGRQNSALLRPWEEDIYYKEYIAGNEWRKVLEDYTATTAPVSVAKGMGVITGSDKGDRDFALAVYKIVAGCGAMGLRIDAEKYLTREEYNLLWSVSNLEHYLTHSNTTLSSAPAEMTSPLLKELMATLETASLGLNQYSVMLRFGHAETMMPLLAQLHIPGCYYMTNYFDTVDRHWRDFYVVPMASNLRMILLKAKSGKLYLRVDLNEVPVTLIPGRTTIYTPFAEALSYMNKCLPIEFQI